MSEWSSGRCPRCGRQIWIESGCLAECGSCGWTEEVTCRRCGEREEADSMTLDDDGYYCDRCMEERARETEEATK